MHSESFIVEGQNINVCVSSWHERHLVSTGLVEKISITSLRCVISCNQSTSCPSNLIRFCNFLSCLPYQVTKGLLEPTFVILVRLLSSWYLSGWQCCSSNREKRPFVPDNYQRDKTFFFTDSNQDDKWWILCNLTKSSFLSDIIDLLYPLLKRFDSKFCNFTNEPVSEFDLSG